MKMMNPKEIKTQPTFERLFPMDKDILRLIEQDMRERGFDHSQPIILGTWEGQKEPVCIDGHTKRQAAINVGIPEVPVWIREDLGTEWDALQYAIKLQCHRRNLTDAERINLLRLCDSRRPRGGDRKSTEAKSAPKSCGNEGGRSASAKEMADMLGCSPRKVEQLRTVMDHADADTLEAVQKGDISGNKAYQETQKKRKDGQRKESKPDSGSEDSQIQANVVEDESQPEEGGAPEHESAPATNPDDEENDPDQSDPAEADEPEDEEGFVAVRIPSAQHRALSQYDWAVEEMVEVAIERYLEYLEQTEDDDQDEYEKMWADPDKEEESDVEAA